MDPVDSQVLYATLRTQGTFKSVDRGASWIPILAGFISGGVAVDPTRHTTIYQAIWPDQVWKSMDGGIHWTVSTILGPQQVGELAVDPAVHTRIYLATNNGVWHSLDGGASWQSSRQPVPVNARNVRALVTLPRPAGAVLAGTDQGLFKSADGGNSWKPVSRPLRSGAITALARASKAGTLWAAVKGLGIFFSTNNGASWQPAATQPQGARNVTALAAAPGAAGPVWVSTVGSGTYRTTDAGAHWIPLGLRPNATITSLALGGSTLYAGLLSGTLDSTLDNTGRDLGGVFASTDGGATWRQRNRGLAGLPVDVALDPRDPEVLWATPGVSGIFRSTGGFNWDFLPLPPAQVDADPTSRVIFSPAFSADGSAFYVVSSHRLWKTVDEGASWREVGPANPPFFITNKIVTDPQDPHTLYAPSGPTLYASHDAGETWQGQNPTGRFLITLAVAPSDPATLYAGGAGGSNDPNERATLYRSTDRGATWIKADAGLPADAASVYVRSVAVDPADARILYAGVYQSPAVWKSTDGGTSWTRIDTGLGLQGIPVLTVSPVDGSVWATDGYQVIVSRNAGATWESFGAPQSSFLSEVIPDPRDANRVYVTGWGGVWLLEVDAGEP